MKDQSTVIRQAEFIRANYQLREAKVAPRSFSSLTYRISGEVSFNTRGKTLVSTADTITFVPAGCGYETTVREAGEMMILHYTIEEGTQDLSDRIEIVSPQHATTILNIFARGVGHSRDSEGRYRRMADAYELLAEASNAFFLSAPMPYKKLAECKQRIDDSFCDRTIRISELAAEFGTSEAYFRREFKKYYGITPIEYIKKQRLGLACQLLRLNLYTVAEVAIRTGFDSISYFSSEFHRSFGCTPSEYRKLS